MSEAIYGRAVTELFQRTYGRLEDRDRIKVVQLFDRLLERGHARHVDDLRRLCRDAGYDESSADDIGHLYDTLCLIRHELENPSTIDYWPPELMQQITAKEICRD
jgi:hypothetical protein